MYVYKSVAESRAANAVIGAFSLAAQDRAMTEGGKAPVSACEPLCAIFLRKPSVYPLSSVKANVGGLGQRCGGNFLAIFAGTVLYEKSNFLSRIFGRGRPFDFSTR